MLQLCWIPAPHIYQTFKTPLAEEFPYITEKFCNSKIRSLHNYQLIGDGIVDSIPVYQVYLIVILSSAGDRGRINLMES